MFEIGPIILDRNKVAKIRVGSQLQEGLGYSWMGRYSRTAHVKAVQTCGSVCSHNSGWISRNSTIGIRDGYHIQKLTPSDLLPPIMSPALRDWQFPNISSAGQHTYKNIRPGDISDSNRHTLKVLLQGNKHFCMFEIFQSDMRDITVSSGDRGSLDRALMNREAN